MKQKDCRKPAIQAPMNVREKRQIRLTRAAMLIMAAFMLISGAFCIADGSWREFTPLRLIGSVGSYVLMLASFSSVMMGEWTIGMIPPGAFAVWVFILSRHWHDITAPRSLPQIVLLAATAILTLLVLVFAVISVIMLSASLKKAGRARVADDLTLVVLGCRLMHDKPSLILRRRLHTAERYLQRFPQMKCILTGGSIDSGERAEADVMREYLLGLGIDDGRLTVENRSTTTYENIRFCKKLAQERSLSMRFAIVTDRFHQYRVQLICRDNGVQCVSVNAETPLCLLPQYWSREILCLFEKWIKRL